ncbi:MAG: LPXTG cell wall anchor domain-containing protein [Lachnospiraceae bacterium]|nr:LPXTG cell wall anchor domain-containing protein [Lachnospiraceae bacterium]
MTGRKTGDNSPIGPLALALMISGGVILLLAVVILLRRRRRH